MGYGLLVYDFVERFLLHYFGMSAHTYTRGTWTTPEATHPDRDVGSTDYVAAGVHTAPTYLKWMLLFEEPNNQTVWLAKALPREWLAAGAEPVVVEAAPSRYGRIAFRLAASQALRGGPYAVKANVSLPPSCFGASGPAGGVRLRLRAPVALAGKLVRVTVGGKPWRSFDPVAETIDFSPTALVSSSKELRVGLQDIVAEWERS